MTEENKAINSEQAFDMLPYVADIYEKIRFDEYRKKLQEQYKGKKKIDPVDPAVDAVKYILKNSGKVKHEFFSIVAIAENRKVAEVKQQSYVKTVQSIKKIFSDPELVGFFKEFM